MDKSAEEVLAGVLSDHEAGKLSSDGVVQTLRTQIARLREPAYAQADEVVCLECGQPTMHMGQVCYACSHPAAKPSEAQAQGGGEVNPWQLAVDQARVTAHLGIAADGVSREDAVKQLGELIDFHVAIATDPAVNGGFQLTPVVATPSAPVGVEAIVDAIISDPANATDTDTLRRCVASALAQQPAAVDGRIAVDLGERLFQFDSKQDWINQHQRPWKRHRVGSQDTVCVDRLGRIVSWGEHFSAAERDNAYPIVVYRLRSDMNQSLAAQPGGSDNDR